MIRRWVILGFLCIIVLMLLWDIYKGAIMYNPFQDIEADAKETTKKVEKALPVFEKGWGSEIIENNLFSPTRNPVQPKPVVKPQDMPKRPELSLRGIILDQFGDYVAYIEKDKAKAVAVRKGDKLDDVEVVDVREKSVDLKWNNESIPLSLEKIKTIKKQR